jgi:hypothetical protein
MRTDLVVSLVEALSLLPSLLYGVILNMVVFGKQQSTKSSLT